MFQYLFGNNGLLDLPILGMLFFIAVFVVVLVRVLSRSRKAHYDRMAQLPLEEGNHPRVRHD